MSTLEHYTLNSGHTSTSPKVGEDVIAALQDLAVHGGPVPGFTPFRVVVTHGTGASIFTVYRGREPVVTCAVAWTAAGEAEAWPAIEKLYLDLSDQHPNLFSPVAEAVKPNSLPWLAVVLLPGLLAQSQDDLGWLADFERCPVVGDSFQPQ